MPRLRRKPAPRLVTIGELPPGTGTLETIGSTALGLLEAKRLGLPSVEAWVLGAPVFREVVRTALPPGHDPASLIRIVNRPSALERNARAWERLMNVRLPEDVARELAAFWASVADRARWGLRVRASSTCAEPALIWLAGLDCELVGVRGEAALADAVRKVWASCVYSDALQKLREYRVRDIAVAVVIELLEPVVACGTFYTEEPARVVGAVEHDLPHGLALSGQLGTGHVVTAALGLGAPVIDGTAACDVLRLSASGELIDARIAVKTWRSVVGEHGPELEAVANERAERPALKPKTLTSLLDIAKTLERGGAGSKFRFLVSRGGEVRVTDVEGRAPAAPLVEGNAAPVWSRLGIGEALPGVPTPLTGSLAFAFAQGDLGLARALATMGGKSLRASPLLRTVHGRYYFDLAALLPALRDLPGMDTKTLLDVLASDTGAALGNVLELRPESSALTRLPLIAARLRTQERALSERVRRFERDAEQQRRWLVEMDLAILPGDALKTTLLETRHLLERTARLLLTSSLMAAAAHLVLTTLLSRSNPISAAPLAQAVTSGVGDLETARLGIALAHVTAIADKDAAARSALISGAVRKPSDLPIGPGRRAVQQFLDAFGEHAIREGELMSSRFAEDASPIFAMIAAGLTARPIDADQRLSRVRVEADRELAALEARVPYVERVLVRALVARSRAFIRLREHMRVWIARALNLLRSVTLDVDRRLRRFDPSLTEGAAFFCNFDELLSAVGSYRADLGPLVRLRRAAYERDRARVDPPETFTDWPAEFSRPSVGNVVLHGSGGSGGVVVGLARLIGPERSGIEQIRAGDIVVLRSLDLGLTPLFFVAAGVVSELGSALSHGAVVARDYGLPAVLGVRGVTTTVRDGERLRIDGARGVVERLDA